MAAKASSDDDEAKLREFAEALAEGIAIALPGWVERSVASVMVVWSGEEPVDVARQAAIAGREAAAETAPRLRSLLATDVDQQHTGPLDVVRTAVRWPTAVLAAAGVPPVKRDEFAERIFPDDVYDLAPASFADVDPALHEAGIAWGAAKAYVVLARRRAEGKR